MSDLTLPGAREQRNALASRTDVLDKVGVLATLPDGVHVTTDMVATFYEAPKETIRTLVRNNRDEIEADGYRVITRGSFEEGFNTKLPSSASAIALFPRRAVLRVGMLLRDSAVARRVRDYLLDTERPLSDDEIVMRALQIQGRKIEALTEKIAELEPKAEFYDELMDANGCYSMLAVSKILGWGRNVMMRDLRRMGILQGNNLPYQRYEHHFKIVPGTYVNAKTGETVPTATTFVVPDGIEFLRKKLAHAPAVVVTTGGVS